VRPRRPVRAALRTLPQPPGEIVASAPGRAPHSPAGGGFTSVDPESRHIVPDAKGRPVVKLVYVVLESQYQSALAAAVRAINEHRPELCWEISGYLLEELRDAKNFEAFKKDVAAANVFIGSLIFIEELAEKIVEAVAPARDTLDACLVFPSMPAVMKLNKLGE
jgi:magnesium chelatase subunit H